MKWMIDIPKEVKGIIDRKGTNENVTETLWQAVKNGIPLEEKTNGEVIQTIFPNASIRELGNGSTIVVANDYKFNITWWNAPYKENKQ